MKARKHNRGGLWGAVLVAVSATAAHAETVYLQCDFKTEHVNYCDPYNPSLSGIDAKGFYAPCLEGVRDPGLQETLLYNIAIDLDKEIVQVRVDHPDLEQVGEWYSISDDYDFAFGPKTISFSDRDGATLHDGVNGALKTKTEWSLSRETLVLTHEDEWNIGAYPDPEECKARGLAIETRSENLMEKTCSGYKNWSVAEFDAFPVKHPVREGTKASAQCKLVESQTQF